MLLVLLSGAVMFSGSGSAYEGPLRAARIATDTTPPVIQSPGDITVPATAPLFTDVTFTVNATDPDNSASEIWIYCSWGNTGRAFHPGSMITQTFSVGTWTLQCYATDPAGNGSATVTFTLTVAPFVDTTPPVIHANDVVSPVVPGAQNTVYYNVGATDPDDDPSAITVTCNHGLNGGEIFPIGTTTVTCTARDRAGNISAPATFTVTFVRPGTTGTTTATTTTSPTTTSTTTASTTTAATTTGCPTVTSSAITPT